MARQPAVGGDYVMVGGGSDDDGGTITIDDRQEADVRGNNNNNSDDWNDLDDDKGSDDKSPGDKKSPKRSILGGGRDDDEGQTSEDRQNDDGGDDEDEEDARLAYEDSDDGPRERGSRRARRNRSRRTAISARDEELAELRARLERAERLSSSVAGGRAVDTARQIEQRIAAARSAVEMGRAEKARAVKEGDGDAFAQIDAAVSNAERELWSLEQEKVRIAHQMREAFDENGHLRALQPDTRQAAERIRRRADHFSNIFQERFSWFDPQGNSREDRLVKRIDRELAAEGEFGTHQAEYWQEMEARLRDEGLKPEPRRGGGDEADGEDERPQREEQRGYRGGGARANRPPTGAPRPARAGGAGGGSRITAAQSDALRQIGFLEMPGEPKIELSKEDSERRDRIVAKYVAANKAQRR